MNNANCEHFELAEGMRRYGALNADEEKALDAHLSGCASCRAFAAINDTAQHALAREVSADVARVDWTAIESGARRLHRSYRRTLWLAPLFLLQVPLSFVFATGHLPPTEVLIAAPPLTVLLFVAYVWLVNRPLRAILRAGRSADDLVQGYATELRRQRTRARAFVVINSVLVAGCLVSAVLSPTFGVRAYSLGCAFVFGVWAAYDAFLKLPRLRRALAEVAP